jgi:ADP-ribose pyrophosphatase YjhB (NUDIX family)
LVADLRQVKYRRSGGRGPGAILLDMGGIPCVGAIITDAAGRLLLIQRGHAPDAGRWSLPGGRVEPGESDEQALVREVAEETGLEVVPGPLAGTVERQRGGGPCLHIRDYRADVTGGELAAGDDAADARWVTPAELAELPLSRGLAETLREWGVIPPPGPSPALAEPSPAPAGRPSPAPAGGPSPALIAEAAKRAGLVWLAVPGQDRPYPAWHIWLDGAAYLVTGPGEQPLPGLAGAARVSVIVASKQTRGTIAEWAATVRRVQPGTAEWASAASQLAARRLNAALEPGEPSPAGRWEHSAAIFALTPAYD